MKKKLKLKTWVKVFLFIMPIAVIMCQLFFIARNIKDIAEKEITIVIPESRCYCGW